MVATFFEVSKQVNMKEIIMIKTYIILPVVLLLFQHEHNRVRLKTTLQAVADALKNFQEKMNKLKDKSV